MPRRPRPDIDHRPAWAKWLVEQRESRGYLQREFADLVHVSQQSLSGYERGVNRVPEDLAEQIAIALNLPHMEVRHRLGMFVPDETREALQGEVIRLPPGVELTGTERRALRALIDVFLEQRELGGRREPDVSFNGDGDVELGPELRPAASDH